MTIYLIGFMGSGKSYAAAKLAEHFDRPYVDLDEVIERAEGRSISTIFAQDGEPAFRDLETKHLRSLTDEHLIVATGGGAPCFHDNMEWMNERGMTVFLNPDLKVLERRLSKGRDHRPLLQEPSELRTLIEEKLEPRRPVYEKARIHMTYNSDEPPIMQLLAQYLEIKLQEYTEPTPPTRSTT